MSLRSEPPVARTIVRTAVRTLAAIVIPVLLLVLGFYVAWHLGLLGHCGPDDPPAHSGR